MSTRQITFFTFSVNRDLGANVMLQNVTKCYYATWRFCWSSHDCKSPCSGALHRQGPQQKRDAVLKDLPTQYSNSEPKFSEWLRHELGKNRPLSHIFTKLLNCSHKKVKNQKIVEMRLEGKADLSRVMLLIDGFTLYAGLFRSSARQTVYRFFLRSTARLQHSQRK